MWEFMKLRQSLQSNTAEGLRRVELGKFAFIHDQPLLLYKSRKDHCGKMKVLQGWVVRLHRTAKNNKNKQTKTNKQTNKQANNSMKIVFTKSVNIPDTLFGNTQQLQF